MNEEQTTPTGGLNLEYQRYDKQRCFVGHSLDAPWRQDLVTTCDEVMPAFGLQPWYAADHFSPTQSLREKVVELIANTRYGIYDLSYWRADDKSEWHMPRNVFIELGVAIALNRPMLLLRHSTNSANHLSLPECLESISEHILEFSGAASLRRVLKERLAQWADTPPEQDWWNRYCIFGNRVCEYREEHPHLRQWGQQTIRCHISDGKDTDRPDFRELVEDVLSRFEDVSFDYLDKLRPRKGYDFLLCTHCQTVRSTPFAIYRITPHTPPETFIAIGMSLALETQFSHTIPKILLTANVHDIPSLLTGYEVVVAQNDFERKTYLRKFTPQVIQLARKTTWKPRPLPFIEVVPRPAKKSAAENEQGAEPESEIYIDTIGKYGVIEEIGRGSMSTIYRVRDTESKQVYAMKVLHPELTNDGEVLAHFQREAHIILHLVDSRIVKVVEYGDQNDKFYIVMEYVPGHNLKYQILNNGPMEPLRVLKYTSQVAEGLDAAYKRGVIHRDITPQNILIDNKDEVKISDFGLARSSNFLTLSDDYVFTGKAYYIAPEQAERGRSVDTRSDLYSLAAVLFEMLAGRPPFEGDTAVDVVIKHMNEKVPSICRLRPELPYELDQFIQKALAKSPEERYQTPHEFIAALDELAETIKSPPEQSAQAIEIFIAYAHADERLRKELEQYLTPLQRQGLISIWHDRQINVEAEWEREIYKHLNTAQIILLLISPDFMASDFCYSIEMKRALERHDAGDCRVIPIILRPVYWKEEPFSKLQVLPANSQAVTTWSSKDEAFTEIMQGLQAIIAELRKTLVLSPPGNLEARVREGVVSLGWHPSSTQASSIVYSIVRKSHAQPNSLYDGQMLDTVPGFRYEDSHPEAGVPLYYAVYAQYDQMLSNQPARLAQPVLLTQDVSALATKVDDQQVTLSWELPPHVHAIVIIRNDQAMPTSFQDGIHVADCAPDKKSLIDRQVQNGQTYYYGIYCQFKNHTGQLVLSQGLFVAATPDLPPRPIDSLTLTSTRTDQGHDVVISWKRPQRGNAAIIKSAKPLALSPGKVIPEAQIYTLGQKLEHLPDSVKDVWTKAGVAYYTSVVLFQEMAYIGASERFACVDNVTHLEHQNIGSAIRFHWKWPENCQEVLISYSPHDWPEHNDPASTTRRIKIAQYEKLGHYDLPGIQNQNYYIVVSALINQDGAQIPAQDIRIYTRIGPKLTFTYEIKNPTRFRRKGTLHLYFTDRTGGTIPALLLISKQDSIPFKKTDGDIFQHIDPFLVRNGEKEKVIPLPERSFPAKTFGKLFLEDDMISELVRINHPGEEKLSLN